MLVGVDSTDKDVVERLAYLTGAGTLTTLQSRQAHWWKIQYRWAVARRAQVELVLSRILPSLGARRTEQAAYVLQQIEAARARFELADV